MHHILKCKQCGSYGLAAACSCGGKRLSPKPMKFSPEDKYGHYRRQKKFRQGKKDVED